MSVLIRARFISGPPAGMGIVRPTNPKPTGGPKCSKYVLCSPTLTQPTLEQVDKSTAQMFPVNSTAKKLASSCKGQLLHVTIQSASGSSASILALFLDGHYFQSRHLQWVTSRTIARPGLVSLAVVHRAVGLVGNSSRTRHTLAGGCEVSGSLGSAHNVLLLGLTAWLGVVPGRGLGLGKEWAQHGNSLRA